VGEVDSLLESTKKSKLAWGSRPIAGLREGWSRVAAVAEQAGAKHYKGRSEDMREDNDPCVGEPTAGMAVKVQGAVIRWFPDSFNTRLREC